MKEKNLDLQTEREIMLEEDRIKKEEEEKIVALYYFTAAYLDIVEQKKIKESISKIENCNFFQELGKPKKQKIADACLIGIKFAEASHKLKKKKKEFFIESLDDETYKEVRNSLKDTPFNEDMFATLAMCAAGDDIKAVNDVVLGKDIKPEQAPKLLEVKKICTTAVSRALQKHKNGDAKEIGKMLKRGIDSACKAFVNARNDDDIAEMSAFVSEIMYVFDSDPKLEKEAGLTTNQLEIARKISELGNEVRKGLMAVEVLISADQNKDIKLTQKQYDDMIHQSLKSRVVINATKEFAKRWNEPVLTKTI